MLTSVEKKKSHFISRRQKQIFWDRSLGAKTLPKPKMHKYGFTGNNFVPCERISTFDTRMRIFLSTLRSRQEREFLSFSLVLQDENWNFFLEVSCFKTRTRISFFQDENGNFFIVVPRHEKFCHLISGFETRTRIEEVFTTVILH